ncbi:MAG TPA: hypothetical protein VMD28_09105 [Acidimicrobiales bacterium]|nr:hypothetical protein [Acidimicrobiales bacterium]
MSGWSPDGASEWQGRPVARRVADATARRRAVLTGVVRALVVHRQRPPRGRLRPGSRGLALDALLDDGTGTITLRWLGREALAGVGAGARLQIEGTVSSESNRLVILNPLYRFSAPTSAEAGAPAGDQPRGSSGLVDAPGSPGCEIPGQPESSTS